MATQRWILSFNVFVVCLLCLFVLLAVRTMQHPYMELFPIHWRDPTVVAAAVIVPVEMLIAVVGIVATCYSRRTILRIYYIAICASVLLDLTMAVVWSVEFRTLHIHYDAFITTMWTQRAAQPPNSFCDLWLSVERNLKCCAVHGVADLESLHLPDPDKDHYCRQYPAQNLTSSSELFPSNCFTQPKIRGCKFPLLVWLHGEADYLSIIAFCMVLLLKLLFVVILRHEMRDLFVDVFNGRYKHVFKHWALEDEHDDVQVVHPGGFDLDSGIAANNQLTVAEVAASARKRVDWMDLQASLRSKSASVRAENTKQTAESERDSLIQQQRQVPNRPPVPDYTDLKHQNEVEPHTDVTDVSPETPTMPPQKKDSLRFTLQPVPNEDLA